MAGLAKKSVRAKVFPLVFFFFFPPTDTEKIRSHSERYHSSIPYLAEISFAVTGKEREGTGVPVSAAIFLVSADHVSLETARERSRD